MKFILSNWEEFCSKLDANNCITVSMLPGMPAVSNWISIKHDVETNVSRALDIARVEAKYKIRATYFIQSYLIDDYRELLTEIAALGHEVTYHYDVLDSNNGDMELALNEFSETVERFESFGFEVNSVCPHGNPMMNRNGWTSNKDFFRSAKVLAKFPEIFDLVVQGRERVLSEFKYISDAGYAFSLIGDIVDNDRVAVPNKKIEGLQELLRLTNAGGGVVISTHPHRWVSHGFIASYIKFRFVFLRKLAIYASKFKLLKLLMSKFYFLAKKM